MKGCFKTALLLVHLFLFTMAGSASAAPAIDFELPNLEGTAVHLSDFKGKIILLKLATTWCPTCTQQSEEIIALSKELATQDLVVVEVFLQDSEKMVREFLADKSLPVKLEALIDDGHVRTAYNVFMIPRVLLIDRNFEIRRDGNFISADDLQREVTLLLEEDRK